ncbi:Glycine/D-amino acid oxidase [Streptomyces sp. yr375]|uniref:NAD(P)/FAD-dependent oxidoreductase n=1 Tax=Streptomyces sp. yr375 TaxID=1761906 RepID=UPI0008C4F79B|nr:FAD-dependent oxidoreductase [Streptomyces sp. yr375]SES04864.1 Glycine/D-amino acid oxidase [Streptomyces sp. yr375]
MTDADTGNTDPAHTDPAYTDVAVVGAGVLGCMTALEILARDPAASVTVLDRDIVGAGASRRSAGLHFPRGITERVRRMTAHSQDRYAKLLADRPELPIHPVPMTVLAARASEPGVREVYLDSAALTPVDAVAGVRLPEGHAAWDVRGGQYADVHALTQALARDLRGRATLSEGTAVTALEPGPDGVQLGLGTGRTLTAGRVVLAPGPWLAAPAWRELVAPLGARVKKIVALHIDVPPAPGDRVSVFHDEDAFLLPLADRGHWLFSYTCQEWDVDPDTVGDDGLSPADLRDALAVLDRYAPGLGDPRRVSGRVFCDAYGPAGEPLVSALTADRRVVFAGAANGSGYRLAPALAAEAADLIDLPAERRKP